MIASTAGADQTRLSTTHHWHCLRGARPSQGQMDRRWVPAPGGGAPLPAARKPALTGGQQHQVGPQLPLQQRGHSQPQSAPAGLGFHLCVGEPSITRSSMTSCPLANNYSMATVCAGPLASACLPALMALGPAGCTPDSGAMSDSLRLIGCCCCCGGGGRAADVSVCARCCWGVLERSTSAYVRGTGSIPCCGAAACWEAAGQSCCCACCGRSEVAVCSRGAKWPSLLHAANTIRLADER